MAKKTRGAVVACTATVLGIVASLAAVTGARAATTITVPGMQPSIQAAIDAAAAGDTVLVSPGTYTENLDFHGKAITVQSSQGAASTIVDGGGSGPVARFATGEARSSVLAGFTLRNGTSPASDYYQGGGIYIYNASPSVLDNVITGNGGCTGVGVAARFSGALIQGNTISNNIENICSGGEGGGIDVGGAGSAQVIGNTITGNHSDFGGGISLFAAGTPTIENNVIENNSASNQGGGIWAVNQSDAAIVQNLVASNTSANDGAGMFLSPPSGTRGPWLTNNTIAANNGVGLTVSGYDTNMVVNNTIVVASAGHTAVVCDTSWNPGAPAFVTNDFFSGAGSAPFTGPCLAGANSSGNLAVDPQFVNPATGDYHLNRASEAVNAGTNTASGLPSTDLDGNARIAGGVVDLGAYEVVQPPIAPGPVTSLQAQRNKSTISVSWAPPISTGGIPITGFVVTRSPGTSQTVSGSTLSFTSTAASKNTAYTITVVALNSVGAGPPTAVTVPKQSSSSA